MPCGTPEFKMAADNHLSWSEWLLPLRCGICQDLFKKPRILPCGHTFCSDCLNEIRDNMIRNCRKSPLFTPVYNSSFPDPNGSYGTGLTFHCPDLDCSYSMKLMNLSRWALRNRAVQDLVAGIKRHNRDLKAFRSPEFSFKYGHAQSEAGTQTDIGMESAIVTIPRSLLPTLGRPPSVMNGEDRVDTGEDRAESDRSVTVGKILQRAFSMDSLNHNYVPSGMTSWKSCAAVIGVNILDQLIHL